MLAGVVRPRVILLVHRLSQYRSHVGRGGLAVASTAISLEYFKPIDIDTSRLTHPYWDLGDPYSLPTGEGIAEGGEDLLDFIPVRDAELLGGEKYQEK